MMAVSLAWIIILGALVVIALVSILNTLTFPRLGKSAPARRPEIEGHRSSSKVSILVPARNEVPVIGGTVQALLALDNPNFELLVLDDASSDGTGTIASQVAGGDQRFRLLNAAPQDTLPPGWTGKNWACQRLAQHANGEILIFTDADVRWQPQALGAILQTMSHTRADVLTVWPTQEVRTWAERLVVPLMNYAILGYLPELAVRYLPWAAFAAANGQCLAFRRQVYEQIGGHQAVRGQVVEDVALAKAAKRAGLRLVMALGDGLVGGRMYENWMDVRQGFAKNILAGHGNQALFLLASTVFHWGLFIFPWLVLLAAALGLNDASEQLAPAAAAIALTVTTRALSAAANRQPLIDALWMPFSAILMTIIAAQSLWWRCRHGGPMWKGRVIHG